MQGGAAKSWVGQDRTEGVMISRALAFSIAIGSAAIQLGNAGAQQTLNPSDAMTQMLRREMDRRSPQPPQAAVSPNAVPYAQPADDFNRYSVPGPAFGNARAQSRGDPTSPNAASGAARCDVYASKSCATDLSNWGTPVTKDTPVHVATPEEIERNWQARVRTMKEAERQEQERQELLRRLIEEDMRSPPPMSCMTRSLGGGDFTTDCF